jgi:hypothetical protein
VRNTFGGAVLPGKQAMEASDRQKVEPDGRSRLECSLYLDKHLETAEPNSSRWDYLLVVRGTYERAVAIEVHPATANEVKVLLKKQQWAIQVLRRLCPTLQFDRDDWYWVASGKVFLRPTDPQFRLLRQSGLKGPMERLTLSSK